MKSLRFVYVLLCSAVMSVFYVPTLFLEDIISWKTDKLVFVYIGFMAVLYGAMLISGSKTEFVLKWVFSLPLSFLVLNYFWKTKFAIRSLNWVFPGYGRQSAGGGFAWMVVMFFFTAFCGIALFIALLIEPKKIKVFERIQLCVGVITAVFIVITVIRLEQHFPSYEKIFCG